MRRPLALKMTTPLLCCLGLALAAGGQAEPLDASFEENLDYGKTVSVSNADGAQATARIDTALAADGKRSLRLTRQNASGQTVATWLQTFPVKPGELCVVSISVHLREVAFGGLGCLQVEELDSKGGTANWPAPPIYGLVCDGDKSFRRQRCVFTAGPRTRALRVSFALAGNPLDVNLDCLTVTTGAAPAFSRGLYNPYDPVPSREKALAALQGLKAREARVERRDGHPTLVVDGQPVPLVIHRGAAHYSSFAKAGVHLHNTLGHQCTLFPIVPKANLPWNPPALREDGSFDFSWLERELTRIAAADPEAMVVVTVVCDPGNAWLEQHPDSIFRTAAGQRGIMVGCDLDRYGSQLQSFPAKSAKLERWCFSYASEEYQDYVCAGLRALARFLRDSPAGKLVIGFQVGGGGDGQYVPWGYSRGALAQADCSPAHQRAFRKWLGEKYGDDGTLRTAWGDPKTTLDSATPYGGDWLSMGKDRLGAGFGPDRRLVDSREFMSVGTARMLRRFLGTLKAEFGRPCVGLTYYSDPIWPQLSRMAQEELFAGTEVDGVATVSGYAPNRRTGATGLAADYCVASAALRGRLHISELDYRTWRSMGADDSTYGAAATPADFQAQIRRDAGAAVARGGGVWFYDMVGSWYDDPACMDVIADCVKMADWANRHPKVSPPKAAVFLDARAIFHVRHVPGAMNELVAWNRSGVAADFYLLDDLLRPDLPDYQLYALLAPTTLNRAQLEAARKKAATPGKTLLVVGAPGVSSPDIANPEEAARLLGLSVRRGDGLCRQLVQADNNVHHPALREVVGLVGCDQGRIMETRWQVDALEQWSYIDDPGALTLGRWSDNGKPALAIKAMDGGTLVYAAARGGFTPRLINNLARLSGIETLAEPGNATYFGRGVAVAHRMCAAPVKLDFDQAMRFFTPDMKDVGAGRSWSPGVEPLQTGLTLYDKAGFGVRVWNWLTAPLD